MKQKLSLIGLVLIILLTVVLSLTNRQVVVVNYLFGQFRMPLILVIIGSLLIGMFIQYLLGLTKSMSLKSEIKNLKRELSEIPVLQKEEPSEKIK
ncbi:LapA family protein [Streptococcus suis]|uniref:LapA family protein n=1 Tax=Streptococcus suis TaxID=1307 RepID=UPI002117B055|nr:LapA family protein [Streptococcus suis]HEP1819640.1 LapA family protein [Streptococcus suis]